MEPIVITTNSPAIELKAQVFDSLHHELVNSAVSWDAQPPGIVTLAAGPGNSCSVVPVNPGFVSIQAAAMRSSGTQVFATLPVTVNLPEPETIEITVAADGS